MSIEIVMFACLMSMALSQKYTMISKSASEYLNPIENFAAVLKEAIRETNCCNLLISGESTTSKNILAEFFRVYSHSYTLNNKSYYCKGYVIISTSVDGLINNMKSVPTTTPTTKLLILIDRDVEESTKLFNVSMYGIVKVNIAAPNGLWTFRHDYLVPAIFKKIPSYREIIRRGKKVNLRGRELIASAFYKPPYCYLRSKENRTVRGIEGRYFIAKNESEVDGVEMRLFMLIAERLNFTWSIIAIEDTEKSQFGYENGSGWSGGIIGNVLGDKADVAFTGLWLVQVKRQFTNLTTPWGVVGRSFLVPRPRPYSSFWALTRPLSHGVWSAVSAMMIIQTIYVCTKAWHAPKISKRFRNCAITFTELMGILVGSYHPTRLHGLQLQLKLWSFIGTLLVTAYSSSLAATLANTRYEDRINTAQDFVKANLTWGTTDLVPSMKLLFDESNAYGEQFIERFEHEKSETDRHKKIVQGNYAIVGTLIHSVFFPDGAIRDEDLKGFRLMKNPVVNIQSTFAVQPWLLESFDMITHRLQQAGLVQNVIKDVLHRRMGRVLREVLNEHDGPTIGPRTLDLIPLGAGFMVLIVGLFISTVVLYFELRSARKGKSLRRLLLEIKRNRMISSTKKLSKKWEPQRLIVFLRIFFFAVTHIFTSIKKITSVVYE